MLAPALLALALCVPATAPQSLDLAARYPATLTHSPVGLAWISEPEDVYELDGFELIQGRDLELSCKRAMLVLGRHGTNVLWAALFPEQPIRIRSRLAGNGERASEVFLRFSPDDLGHLFPARTVRGPGDASWRARAARLFRNKLGWRWYTPGGNTTVVPKGVVLVDFDGDEGKRRLFVLERGRGEVAYVADFEDQLLPPLTPIEPQEALAAWREVWGAFDAEYAKFGRHPDLDWTAHGKGFEPRLRRVTTTLDLGGLLADALRVLEDLHVWVRVDGVFVPGYSRPRPLNADFQGSNAALGGVREAGPNLWIGSTEDGIGYLNVHGLTDPELPGRVDAALDELATCWGLVIDLRFNGGGNELLARAVAGRFVDGRRVYAQNRFRSGPAHRDLGPVLERSVEPRGPWRWSAPTLVLQGPVTLSSAESFVLMLAQAPGVTTLGSATGGSSGNPRSLEPAIGMTVNLPRWLDLGPAGEPIEGVGVPPMERLEFEPGSFSSERDPLLLAALERLRRVPLAERRPGKP